MVTKPKLKTNITTALQQVESTGQPQNTSTAMPHDNHDTTQFLSSRREVFRTSILLPAVLTSHLRVRSRLTGQTCEETIMRAYITHVDKVVSQHETDPLVRLGITPAVLGPVRDREKLSITLPYEAHQALDRTADRLGMNRSEIVAAVLQADLFK